MNTILGTMAGVEYKVRHEKLLFGLRMLFFLGRGGGGAGLGLKVFKKTLKRILNRLIVSAQANVIVK